MPADVCGPPRWPWSFCWQKMSSRQKAWPQSWKPSMRSARIWPRPVWKRPLGRWRSFMPMIPFWWYFFRTAMNPWPGLLPDGCGRRGIGLPLSWPPGRNASKALAVPSRLTTCTRGCAASRISFWNSAATPWQQAFPWRRRMWTSFGAASMSRQT